MIIGAQKAGTTTLYDMLDNLNGFSGSKIKEVGFFSKDHFYSKGEVFYLEQFLEGSGIHFEATPEYFYYDFVPERIYKFDKNMKFIVLLREPVSRCYSSWNMFRTFNKNNPLEIYNQFTQYGNKQAKQAISSLLFADIYPSFTECVNVELSNYENLIYSTEPSFVKRGIYINQLKNYLKFFNKNNFLFLEQRELMNSEDVLNKICDFMSVKYEKSKMERQSMNVGKYDKKSSSDEGTFSLLKEFYAPYNEQLFHLIGKRYDWNN